jgi:alkaline phosphatase
LLVLLCVSGARAQEEGAAAPASPAVRNLILMIGDGMGPKQVQLASDYSKKPLTMESLPVRGALQTFSANNAVTDSAAAGTALACGKKTNNGTLGQLPDGTKLVSIAEHARDAGKRVGLLTSVPINHATPAAFYAKAGSRNSYYDIGVQALASRFEVLAGKNLSDADGGNVKPRPEQSLWQKAEAAGRKLVKTPAALQSHAVADGPVLVLPDSLYSEAGVPYGRPFDPATDITLAQMTAKAVELLDNPKGFFLMVEGGAIDHAGHANDMLGNVAETLAFDEAIAVAKAFAGAHPGTLLVVTADHETGGLTFQEGYDADAARLVLSRQLANRSVIADGLRKRAAAAKDEPDAGWAATRSFLSEMLGVPNDALSALEKSYGKLAAAAEGDRGKAADALVRDAFAIRDATARLAWTTGGHTATDVPLFAFGPGSERFAGTQDNTQVFVHGMEALLPAAP